MRGPLNERLFAWYYPLIMGVSELAGHHRIRQAQISQARGRVLEIGAGNGYNLRHYTASVSELVLSEPSPHMRRLLRAKSESHPPSAGSWEVVDSGAEGIPFPDGSFDTAVGTYVHCTVPDSGSALDEIYRVLRPGGSYVFIEHVRAPDGTVRARLQDALAPMNRFCGAGCNPNRRTERALRDSRLTVEKLRHTTMPLGPSTVRPIIVGTAHR